MALNCGVRPPVTTKAGYSLLQNSSNNATNEPLVTTIFSPRSSYMLSGFCMVGSMQHEYTDQGGGASTRVYQYNYGGGSHEQKVGDHDAEMNGQAPFYMRNNSDLQLQVDDQGRMAEMVDEQGYKCVHPSEMKKRRLSNEQVKSLEVSFDMESKLEPDRKNQLAQELGLEPRQVAVWFQNRRARYKTKQLERDYDILKQQFDAVRSEKDKLQAEVARLKGLLDAKTGCGKGVLTAASNDEGQDEMESPHENQDDDLQNLSTSSGGAGKQKASFPCTTSGGQKAHTTHADAFSTDNSNQTHAHVKVKATRKSPKLDVKPSLVADPHLLLQQFRSNLNPLSTSPHHMIAVKMEENHHLHEPEYNLSYIREHHDFHNIDHEEDDDDTILYFSRWHHDP